MGVISILGALLARRDPPAPIFPGGSVTPVGPGTFFHAPPPPAKLDPEKLAQAQTRIPPRPVFPPRQSIFDHHSDPARMPTSGDQGSTT